MDRTPIWPYAPNLMLLAALSLTFACLGYACTAGTPPDCLLDPEFESGRDFGPAQPPEGSRAPGPILPGN